MCFYGWELVIRADGVDEESLVSGGDVEGLFEAVEV